MDDDQGESASQREGIHPDWITVSIGVMTIATIVAAGTVAAAISVSREPQTGLQASSEREQQAKRAAIGLNIQVYAVVIFALIAIVGPFLVVEQG